MTLEELKKREKELRKKYGDELYEKLYIRYSAAQALQSIKTQPPVYKPAGPAPAAPLPQVTPNIPVTPFEHSYEDPPKSIEDYRKNIEDINKRIGSLNKQQYQHMLTGNDNKVKAIDLVIKNAERIRDSLKKQMSAVMGIGSESKDKGMLRGSGLSGGGQSDRNGGMDAPIGGRPQFNVNNMQQWTGINDKYEDDKVTPPDEEEKKEPVTLYYPGTKNPNYINREDYDNVEDYYRAIGERWSEYVSNDDREGLEEFLKANNMDSGPSTINMIYEFEKRRKEEEGNHHVIALDGYSAEKRRRVDALLYSPSEDFKTLIGDGLESARYNLDLAKKMGNTERIAEYEEKVGLYESIEGMFANKDSSDLFRYHDLEIGLQAAQTLVKKYQQDMFYSRNSESYQESKANLDLVNKEMITINRDINAVGEARLDSLDKLYKNKKISKEDYSDEYKSYYRSVIERESLIEVESRSPKDNLEITNGEDYRRMNILESLDIPLYSTEKDAVFAFKKESMPLTLDKETEFSAVLKSIDLRDSDTGEVKTYYYYTEIRQGTKYNVVGNALLGTLIEGDKILLHTHPVEGYWGRSFSGNPQNDGFNKYYFDTTSFDNFFSNMFLEAGDSSVTNVLGYKGIYVITSGAEVKLYEGHGDSKIGSGHSTHADTMIDLYRVSTIDLY